MVYVLNSFNSSMLREYNHMRSFESKGRMACRTGNLETSANISHHNATPIFYFPALERSCS